MASKEKLEKAIFSYTSLTNNTEEENRLLRETISQLKNEVDKYRTPALMLAEVSDIMADKVIIKLPNGNKFFVEISSMVENLFIGDTVLVEQKNLTVVDKIKSQRSFAVEKFVILEKPNVSWDDVGGLASQKTDIIEVVELPLKKPELFKRVGIQPPKGILLYGPPGNGKTLLAKAVANSTNSAFIEIVGSELVQKFIGEGAKLVKEIFELARAKAPAIVFIDELDALAAKRIELGTSGEREVQRTFMQLLAEIDGFKPLGNVKIIGCTNRIDILDPAILRPGRLDRLIKIPYPGKEEIRQIFKIHTRNMKFDPKVDVEKICNLMQDFSGAEIKATVTEAGYFAIRENRFVICQDDFVKGVAKVKQEENQGTEYLGMFG